MPINLYKEDFPVGNIIYKWKVSEYDKHERGKRWYMVIGVIGIFLTVYSLLSSNYLFALIIILFGLILFLQDMQQPIEVPFAISQTGIIIGGKFYKFSELSSFWIIYNPPMIKNLYFSTSGYLRHRIRIPLHDYDPGPIKDILNQYLEEDLEQEDEPFSDRIGRVFKLH